MGLVLLATFIPITLGTALVPTSYDSTARVFIRKSQALSSLLSVVGMQTLGSSQSISETDMANYLALAEMRPVYEKVIEEENITRERIRGKIFKYLPFLKPPLRLLGVDVDSSVVKMTAEDLVDFGITSYVFPRPYVEFEQYEDSNVVDFIAYSTDREQAMRIVNGVARVFLAEEVVRVRAEYANIRKTLNERLKTVRDEYVASFRKVAEYNEAEKVLDLSSEISKYVDTSYELKKNIVNAELGVARIKQSISRLESRLKNMPAMMKTAEDIKVSDVAQSLKNNLKDYYLQRAEMFGKYTSEHPAVIDVERKIDEAKKLIAEEAQKEFFQETVSVDPVYTDIRTKLSSLYSEMAGYEGQQYGYQKIYDKLMAEALKLSSKSADFSQLKTGASVMQDIYQSLLKYMHQVDVAEAADISNMVVAEPGIVEEEDDADHMHPSVSINAMLGIALGVLFGITFGLLAEYADNTVASRADARKEGEDDPVVAEIPVSTGSTLVSSTPVGSPFREAFRNLRRGLNAVAGDGRAVAVLSCGKSSGKSLVAANLAAIWAMEGKRVLLVDANPHAPTIHDMLGLPMGDGLGACLAGQTTLEKAVLPTPVENLFALTADRDPALQERYMETDKAKTLFAEMKTRYDMVIVDTPSATSHLDGMVAAALSGSALLVAGVGATPKDELAVLRHRLGGEWNVGKTAVALNNLPVPTVKEYAQAARVFVTRWIKSLRKPVAAG